MVNATTVKGLAERLAKAEQLVADGAVFPVAGLDGYAVVRNGDGASMYLVRVDAGHEHCTCPDFRERQSKAGLPCKHILAGQLTLGNRPEPPAPAARSRRTATDADVATAVAIFTGGKIAA